MRSVRVYCGSAAPKDKLASDIVLDPAVPQGQPGYVNIKVHDLTRRIVSDLPPRLLDLLEIASYVYAADQLVPRDTLTMPRLGVDWRRAFAFHIAIRDLAFWSRTDVGGKLFSLLHFMSEDNYSFVFVPLQKQRLASQPYLEYSTDGPPSGFIPGEVAMFSGGLDSFAGAIAALKNDRRVALVSHRASPMVAGVQQNLVQALRRRFGQARVLHFAVEITRGHERAKDFTQRTRSFLFAVLGFLVGYVFDHQTVNFYENGVVSLNLPLAGHVVGSRATCTTHPKTLKELSDLFCLVAERDVRVENPFFWKTKTEVVQSIADCGCGDLIASTFSCASVREATKLGGRHCGTCTQCLDRRFGVLAADCARFEAVEGYDVDLFRGPREAGVDTITAESYVLAAVGHARSSETAFLGSYAEALRAVPYLRIQSYAEAMGRLHRLHQRHGQAVTAVIDQELLASGTIAAKLALPDNCLLAMIAGSRAQDIVCVDPVEREPSATAQAESRPRATVMRPITFSFYELTKRATFADEVVLVGKPAELIRMLLPNFTRGVYLSVEQLAERFGLNETAMR